MTVIPPAELPATLPELARYDAVVLANVPAAALPTGAMEALPIYVRDLGKGLLMTGGDNAFGAGGYLRTPLETAMPVYMDVKSRELAANLALMVAVDKSGSMGRCHCDNPDLNQTYTPVQTGQPKVDIAKEAIMRSAAALGEEDYLGVVTFDSQAHWALDVQPLVGAGRTGKRHRHVPGGRPDQHGFRGQRGLPGPGEGECQAQAHHPDDGRLGAHRRADRSGREDAR